MNLIKNSQQIEKMRKAGSIVAKIHRLVESEAKIGVNLLHLDKIAHELIVSEGGVPTFLGYNGFPKTICTSLNNTMVHGIPTDYNLKDGDLVSLDVGVSYQGYCADAAISFIVGEGTKEAKELVEFTKQVLSDVIDTIKPGVTLGDVGHFIETKTKQKGYTISKNYVGHFIGEEMHQDPMVPNYGKPGKGLVLEEGMTLCIEPMVIIGKEKLFVDPLDNWSVKTKHNGLTSHEEHTILITKEKGEILTK